jgi:hypothetical protein
VEGSGPIKNLDAVPFVPHVDPTVPHAVIELLPQYALCSQFPPTVWNWSIISLGTEVEGIECRAAPVEVVLVRAGCDETNVHGLAICPLITDDRYQRVAGPDPSVPSITVGYSSAGQRLVYKVIDLVL